jgi:hypothetical protein
METLFSHRISGMFDAPVHPINFGCPDYDKIIKTPMDLGLVQENLDMGDYSTVDEWKNDVTLVWLNGFVYARRGSYIWNACEELQKIFEESFHTVFGMESAEWEGELRTIAEDFSSEIRAMTSTTPVSKQRPQRPQKGPPRPFPRHRGPKRTSSSSGR